MFSTVPVTVCITTPANKPVSALRNLAPAGGDDVSLS